jgi:head-tail adaptor
MSCNKKSITSSGVKVCISSLDTRIVIQKREVVYYSGRSEYTFTDVYTVWANLKTKSGISKFSDVNINNVESHIWTIRKITGLTSEYWINYNNNRYRIIAVENIDGSQYQVIYSRLTGEDDLDGSAS